MNKRERVVAVLAFTASSIGTGALVAHATDVSGAVGDCGVHSGYHFYDQAYAFAYAGSNDAAEIQTYVGSGNAPSGWLGAQAQLIRASTGNVVATSSMQFNSGAAHGRFATQYWSYSFGSGNYQSKGKSAAWNSSSGTYSYYGALTSPAIYMTG